MSKLDRYANASAGKREERLFLVFAKLNTRRDFSVFDLLLLKDMNGELLQVSHRTMLSYLKTIQQAQMMQAAYRNHLAKTFETQPYAKGDLGQELYAREQYAKWQTVTPKADQTLAQYTFTENQQLPAEMFYTRLEQALLVFGYLVLKG